MAEPDRRRLGAFFGALVVLALAFVGVAGAVDVSLAALGPAYMFTPLVAGVVVVLAFDVPAPALGLRVGRPRWAAAAVGVALLLVALTLVLSAAFPGVGLDPTAEPEVGVPLPSGAAGVAGALALAVGLGVTVNAVFALGEEFGWRGYLLRELAPLGFWKASLAVGAAWGLWHAPLVVAGRNYPSFPLVGVAVMTAACVALSPVYTYVVVRAESLLAAVLLHGTFNSTAGFVAAFAVTDGPAFAELVASPIGLAGVLACGVVVAGVVASGVPALDREFAAPGAGDAGTGDSAADPERGSSPGKS